MITMLSAKPAGRRRSPPVNGDEVSLRDLRKALALTQTDVARRLKTGQEVISRIEQRQDLLLSTLQGYVESLGGELELVCRFKNHAAVRVKPGITKPRKPSSRPRSNDKRS
jgi:transcriptional regulator with XRE-family HTH domain